jgi:hypothetical protein
MNGWIKWAAPAAIMSIASPGYAVQYMTVAEAQRQAYPSATSFVPVDGRASKAMAGAQVLGLVVFDHVIGKHLYIDYTVAIDPGGRVRRVDILQYRESYGDEVTGTGWLAQFVGKTSASTLQAGSDIRNISGATLSSHHVAEGVKRVLSAYGGRVR